MSDLENRISRLSDSKRKLLELYLHQRSLVDPKHIGSKIKPREPGAPVPLAFTQESMWFLSQSESDVPFYNIPSAFKLTGRLNYLALKNALEQIVARHEVLRTTYKLENGHVSGIIQETGNIELRVHDLSGQGSDQEDRLYQLIDQAVKEPFDLVRDLPIRSVLFRLAEDQHVFLIIVHHIASDNWSNIILWNELSEIYAALIQDREPKLVDLPIQYADYTTWQRSFLSGNNLDKQVNYWQTQLKDANDTLELPGDHKRPIKPDYSGTRCKKILPSSLIEALRAVGGAEKATLFMTMLAAFYVLIHRYTEQTDISLGSPIAGRHRLEIEHLIGNFINTLVLRCDLSGNPSYLELLRRVRNMALDAYANQDVPFEMLLQTLQPERKPGSTPFFQVMFDFLGTPPTEIKLFDLEVSRLNLHSESSTLYDFLLYIGEEKQGYRIEANYKTCLFEKETIQRLLDHYQILLESILEDPNQPIHSLKIISNTELHQLLDNWSYSKSNYIDLQSSSVSRLGYQTVLQLFEDQSYKNPLKTAVVYQEHRINYGDLNARANQLGHYLKKLGVGPDVPVGINIPRSIEMIVAILGVLKAGGAYLPVDLHTPSGRLSYILSDARSPILLTLDPEISQSLPDNILVVSLDSDWRSICEEPTLDTSVKVSPLNLAYIIYTSGSTGTPKGVMIPHSALSNQMLWVQSAFDLQPDDKFLQKTPFTFDASVWEIFAPLLVGAQLILAEPEGHVNPDYLISAINTYGITLLQVVPSLLQLLISEGRFKSCKSLRKLFCGGEALSTDLVELTTHILDVEIVNLYGPTETCINATYWTTSPGEQITHVPIGMPTANMKVYVLDPYLNPVPVGIPGELYIGGCGLARGYLDRPELTAEKFIPDPFSTRSSPIGPSQVDRASGERLYRSGDLVRYLPDGNLEFLGRMDNQVKLRGFRIELGEIESLLNQYPGIRQAVANVREDQPGDHRLVVYLVADSGNDIDPSEIREYLKAFLPAYMLPSTYVFMEAFPTTSSGKVDRRALPIPDIVHQPSGASQGAPQTPLEQVLAGIFSQVLGVTSISVHDNFFDMGGHSLLAIRLSSQIGETFDLEIPMRTVFESPTVAEMAEQMLANPENREKVEDTARLLLEIAQLSEAEASKLLDQIKRRPE